MKQALLAAACIATPLAAHATPLLGINMSGLEMNSGTVAYTDYGVPAPPFTGDLPGPVQVMRVPFTFMRLIQNGVVNQPYLGFIVAMDKWDLANGIQPIDDDHEYGTTAGLDMTTPAGAAALAAEWALVVPLLPAGTDIDTMNEPNGAQTNAGLVTADNMTIAAVRAEGYTGTVFVEPTGYARAAQVTATWPDFNGIVDPSKNTDLEVHWYLDPNDDGKGEDPASPTAAASVMQGVVAYQQSGHSPFGKVLLGETAVGQTGNIVDAAQAAALKNMLAVVVANPSTFYGVTMWAAGPWWPASYRLAENTPTNAGYVLAEQAFTPLTVYLSEDAYQGDAQATVSVDGTAEWTGAVTASRFGTPQAVPISNSASLAPGTHTVTVTFSNDAWGGSTGADRNLFVDGATWSGIPATSDGFQAQYGNGSTAFHVVVP